MAQVIQQIGNYRILKSQPLGTGATGSVYYGQNKEGVKVAVKSIDIKKITKSIEKQIQNEIKNLTNLVSPFIVKLYDYFRSGENIYIVLEYCEDGDLKHYLEKNKKNQGLSQAEALTFMRHLMYGYKALLDKNIIHRDIKPANILLKQGVAKLSDFGFSRVVEDPDKTQKLTLLGTPLYTAPQILANHDFSNKCDVWSMGVVFYQMLHARTPWTGTDLDSLRFNIQKRKLEFKPNVNAEIKQLIVKMLIINPKDRASWQILQQHSFFAKPVDLNVQKKVEIDFNSAKKYLHDYLQTYLVKSYLLLDMNAEVKFAPNEKPLGSTEKSEDQLEVEKQTNQLTLRRNIAFMHMYILALYYRNQSFLPKEVNKYMELQYGLIYRAYDLLRKIGEDFQINNKMGKPRWIAYKKTPQYAQLKALLINDERLLVLLVKTCRKQIGIKIAQKILSAQTKTFIQKFDADFNSVFGQAMQINMKYLQKSKKGVCFLIADYIKNYILNIKYLQENKQLDFSSFYQRREKEYGLD